MCKNTVNIDSNRFFLLSWLVMPLVFIWLIVSYFVGIDHKPIWAEPFPTNACSVSNVDTNITFQWKKTGLITFWFDDGWLNQYSTAYPILRQKNFNAAVSIITSSVDTELYMSWAQIKKLQYNGWEITSHSVNHICEKNQLDQEKVDKELKDSKSKLESEGLAIENFTTPCGANVDYYEGKAKDLYLSLRTSYPDLNSLPVTNPYGLKIYAITPKVSISEVNSWIERAKKENKWLILVFHQVDDTNQEYGVSPSVFLQIVNVVEKSGLPVVLPVQALNLVEVK